ncbi:phage tail protein [Lonsdalea populi]|uniref:phage tail protein n=1 Tax=Lonsdalea populi TaxID=1172565 RepID=UPI000A1E03E5|nr:phage tail protein [Lonsdalea populi]OSM94647.1 phage tail protein [Lonsdalea populi]QPQ23739.1 phage tail protein [Lonsdalea populi]RAT40468.1 phage tail protein [Lonsdalea populi]RAT41322.1 phage tail protein [Lonsdalea populi]RAT52503.1 phage tail protein [Lonsdalea populi]
MQKPPSLRRALTEAVPAISANPECLHLFVDNGAVIGTLAPSLSWEYRYTLNMVITDFAGDQNLLMAPILHWLREHQPDALASPDSRDPALSFEVDILNHQSCDLSINLKLTERVLISERDGAQMVAAIPEPAPFEECWTVPHG